MKRTALILSLCLPALVAPPVAEAKSLSRLLASTGLAPDDFLSMGAAARSLYDRAEPAPGSTASWKNAQTGSKGTVRLEALSGGCAALLHTIEAVGKPEPQPIRTKQCKDANGNWQLSN